MEDIVFMFFMIIVLICMLTFFYFTSKEDNEVDRLKKENEKLRKLLGKDN